MDADRIESLLPEIFLAGCRPGSPTRALVELMQALHAPIEDTLGALDEVFDPRRCPEAFVPYLGVWVDLRRVFQPSHATARGAGGLRIEGVAVHAVRELVAAAARLSRTRGTRRGLIQFLETVTGVPGFAIENDTGPDAAGFEITVHVPRSAESHLSLIEALVRQEKPAHVRAKVVVDG